jgi:hypothetical protein
MVFQPNLKLTSLRKRKINSSKSTSKMMERISNCPNNRGLKNSSLISEMYESFDAVRVQLGGGPLFLFMAGSFIQGAMKEIYYSHSERRE